MLRYILSAILIFCFLTIGYNQIVDFPDAHFKQILLSAGPDNNFAGGKKIDLNADGEIQLSEAEQIDTLNINYYDPSGYVFEGIKSFKNLIHLSLDKLRWGFTLDVADMTKLKYIDVSGYDNEEAKIIKLKISGCTALEYLNYKNQHIENLDASGLLNLKVVQFGTTSVLKLNDCSKIKKILCLGVNDIELKGTSSVDSLILNFGGFSKINLKDLINLKYMYINSDYLDSLNVTNNTNIEYLKVQCQNLSFVNLSGLTKLTYLDCRAYKKYTMDLSTNKNLKTLYCTYTNSTKIDFSHMQDLELLLYSFSSVDTFKIKDLPKIKYINISDNDKNKHVELNNLPQLDSVLLGSKTLKSFKLFNLDKIQAVSILDNNFTSIKVSDIGLLKHLKIMFGTLNSLDVSELTNLEILICSYNKLTNLDLSNLKKLTTVICSNNLLDSINFTGCQQLDAVNAKQNNLTTLDLSSNTRDGLYVNCNDNALLTTAFLKNGVNTQVGINANNNLKYICCDDEESLYHKNRLKQLGNLTCEVNSYCSFNNGGTAYSVSGVQKFDENLDGCDGNDRPIQFVKYKVNSPGNEWGIISNLHGQYNISVGEGNYSIKPEIESGNYFNINPDSINVDFPGTNNNITQDFCITPVGQYKDLEILLFAINEGRPGFESRYSLIYKNKGNVTVSGDIKLKFEGDYLQFINASQTPSIQNANEVVWNYSLLQPLESREISLNFKLNKPSDPYPLVGGEKLRFGSSILPILEDEDPDNNEFEFIQDVVNSFDPNDKTCLSGKFIDPIKIGDYLHYIIRFENIGTASARNIVVKDIIDTTKYEVESLLPVDASHSFMTRINNNTVEFIFENVNLPFDPGINTGFIVFKIKTKSNLQVNDEIKNRAEIYFDFNAPIITNDAISVFTTLGTSGVNYNLNKGIIIPNPATNAFEIRNLEHILKVDIYNVNGKMIRSVIDAGSKIYVEDIVPGNYFVKAYTSNSIVVLKLVKI